jgi:hypothetical protein
MRQGAGAVVADLENPIALAGEKVDRGQIVRDVGGPMSVILEVLAEITLPYVQDHDWLARPPPDYVEKCLALLEVLWR